MRRKLALDEFAILINGQLSFRKLSVLLNSNRENPQSRPTFVERPWALKI